MQKKTLRDQITAYLSSVEDATATQITKHTSEKDYPSRVLRELNDMRTDTLIECGKKGKGRDLSYWLISAASAPHAPAEIPSRTTEGADMRRQIIRSAIAGKTSATGPSLKDLAIACGVTGQAVEHLLAPMLSDGTVGKARTHGERFQRFFDTQAITPPQPEVGQNTGSDGSDFSGSMDSAEAVAVLKPAPASCANTAPVAEDDCKPDFDRDPELQYLASEDYEMPPPDPALLASANRMLSERVQTLETDRDELARKYAAKDHELLEQARLVVSLRDNLATTEQKRLATTSALTAAMQQLDAIREHLAPFPIGVDAASMTEVALAETAAAAIRDGLERIFAKSSDDGASAELVNARALADKLQTLLDSKTHECEALRTEVERLRESVMPTLEATEPEQAIDVLEAASAYLVRAPKRKPRILNKPEAAREAALACARNGSGRGDVYALVHIGTARRGAEWKDA